MKEYLGDLLNGHDRVLIAQNGNSTSALALSKKVADAKIDFESDPALKNRLLIFPKRDNFADTIEDIEDNLTPGDILVAVGGDGTGSGSAQAIMNHPDREVRKAPLLILPGGNANLGSNDLLDRQGKNLSILDILARGEEIDFRPIGISISNPLEKNPREEIAFFIGGVGISASIVNQLEQDRFNKLRNFSHSRLAVDAISLIKGAVKQNQEPINYSVNGKYFNGAGILSVNVDRYAKVFKTPAKAEQEGFYSLNFPSAKLIQELGIGVKLLRGKADWKKTNLGESLEIVIFAEPDQEILIEGDGEIRYRLPSDKVETVETKISQKPLDETIKMIKVPKI